MLRYPEATSSATLVPIGSGGCHSGSAGAVGTGKLMIVNCLVLQSTIPYPEQLAAKSIPLVH